jgi:hypothetical protein
MKFSLLIITLFVVGCASNSSQKMEEKTQKSMKTEKVKAEVKVEKEMAKPKAMKTSAAAKTCSLGGDKRSIDIKKMDKGCEVFYSKNGKNKSIASAQNDLGYCDSIQDRITSKLTTAGFTCE